MPKQATGGGTPDKGGAAQHGAPGAIKKKQTTTTTAAQQERDVQKQASGDAQRRAAASRAAAAARARGATPRVPRPTVPKDPVGATLDHVRDIQGGGGGAAAQAAEAERAKNQKAAAQEYLRRADPDYDPATQGRRAARKGGDEKTYGDTDTELLLNAIGYTGNGTTDFQQTVERVNKTFQEVFGEEPTPAFVLDIVRSPAAQDPTSLRRLFEGKAGEEIDPYKGANALDIHRFGLTPMTDQQMRDASYKRAFASAVSISLLTGQDMVTATQKAIAGDQMKVRGDDVLSLIHDPHMDTIDVRAAKLQMTMPISTEVAASIVGLDSWLQRYGVQGQVNESNTYEENQRIIDAAVAGKAEEISTTLNMGSAKFNAIASQNAHDGLERIKAFQDDMRRAFNISLPASGVIDRKWADTISRLQSNRAYALMGVAQRAASEGFGDFDAYAAIDTSTSEYADNAEGRKAKKAVDQYQGALQRRQYAIDHNSLGRRVYENMPLQAFANDGVADGQGVGAVNLGLGTMDYILGGSDFALTEHHGAQDIALDIPNIAEKGLIRGVTTLFGASNGLLQQTKSDLYSAEAFGWDPGGWNADMDVAKARLKEENPTWLNMVFNDPDARDHLAGYLQNIGLSEEQAKGASNWTDFASDIGLDIMLSKRFAPVSGDFARAARAARRSGDVNVIRATVHTDARIQDSIRRFISLSREGKASSAVEELGSVRAAQVVGRRDYLLHDDGAIEFSPLADDAYKQGRVRNTTNEPGGISEPARDLEHPDTGLPKVEHPLVMPPKWIEAPEQDVLDLTTPPAVRPVEPTGQGGLRDRIAAGEGEATVPAPVPPHVNRTIQAQGEWVEGGPTGTVGAGASFQLHRGVVNAEGNKVSRIIIRQSKVDDNVQGPVYANELKADLEPGGFLRVKYVRTDPGELRKGYAKLAYADLFRIGDELGAHTLLRDFAQSPEAKKAWQKGLAKVAENMGWEYKPGNAYAEHIWNVDADFSYAREAYPENAKAVVKNADLGYFQKVGTDLATRAEKRAEARAAAAAERAGLTQPVETDVPAIGEPRRMSLLELTEAEHADDAFIHSEIERHAAGLRLFHNLWADWSVPYKDRNLLPRSWSAPLFHPIRGTRMAVWEAAGRFLDHADITYRNSTRTEAGGLLRMVTRQVREQFTRAANWREIPVQEVDPKNIERLALTAGADIGHARVLSRRWILAVGNNNPAEWNAIRDEIGAMAIAQGRDTTAHAMHKAFAAAVDRRPERGIWEKAYQADPESVFGPGGLVETRQWAALSAVTGEHTSKAAQRTRMALLRREIESRGMRPMLQRGVYDGGEEMSFLVPGMSPSEAIEIGRKFNQESIATNKGLYGASEHVWNEETKAYDKVNDALPPDTMVEGQGIIHGDAARKLDFRSETKFGETEHPWALDLSDWNARPVTDADLRSAKMGEIYAMNQKRWLEEQAKRTDDPEEQGILDEMAVNAKNEPSPTMPEEMMQNFSVPELGIPRTPNNFAQRVARLNDGVLRVAAINRRMILVTDPILFFKHLTADTARRILAEGGVRGWKNARATHGRLEKFLSENPDLAGEFNRRRNLLRNGELRFDVDAKAGALGRGPMEAFDSADAIAEATRPIGRGRDTTRLATAAAYIDRRLIDGAAQAWRVRGSKDDLIEWLETNAKGRALVESEGLPADRLASMLHENLTLIRAKDPSFLEDAERVRTAAVEAGQDSRKAIAKWLVKERRSIPVTGHGTSEDVLNLAHRFDDVTSKIVGGYLTFNKWNRDGLFYDMTAKHFDDFVRAGYAENEAFDAAMGVAHKINRHHMLDLADALTIEQTLRWSAYFFTKHRLYWSWLASTMVHKPHLAIALHHMRESLYAQSDPEDPSTQGKLSFDLPDFLPGVEGAGGRIKYTVPVARLFWLLESQGQPGAIAMAEHAITSGDMEQAIPFTKNSKTELTTIDSAVKSLFLLGDLKVGNIKNSDQVESHLNPSDTFKFRQVYNRIQFAHMQANGGRPLTDSDATAKTLQHMAITMFWRGSGFTGGYLEDPNRSSAQEKIWKSYNDAIDPLERERIRDANPWLESMIGVGFSSPRQHTLSRKLWAEYAEMLDVHDNRQNALLRRYQKTGDPRILFGSGWRNEANRFNKAYDDFKARAKKIGATDWLAGIERDPFVGFTQTFAATLHDLYPGMDESIVKKMTGQVNPAWVNEYRHALDTTLSDEYIAKLPKDQQNGAYVMRSFYRQQLTDYNSAPSTDAEKVRRSYFDTVYGPYQDKLGGFFDRADRAPTGLKGDVYDKMLAFKIANDHPVKVDGYTFPSPERTHWVFLPKEAQYLSNEGNLTKQWGWLTQFEKERLGVKTSDKAATGWVEFNRIQNEHERKTARVDGTAEYLTDEDRLKLAREVDGRHPGFFKDYVFGLQPTYVRALKTGAFGATPHAKKGWKEWLGKVDQTASLLVGGPHHPPTSRPDLMLMWNAMFRKSVFTTLMYQGLPGVDGGRPAGSTDGWLYRQAMKSPNQEFRTEFVNAYNDDPDLIVKLFQVGG